MIIVCWHHNLLFFSTHNVRVEDDRQLSEGVTTFALIWSSRLKHTSCFNNLLMEIETLINWVGNDFYHGQLWKWVFFKLVYNTCMFADYWIFINSNHILNTVSFEYQSKVLSQMTRFYAVNILSMIFWQK